MMNLENTKIYTKDPEVIRKYAELCGGVDVHIDGYECEDCVGYYFNDNEIYGVAVESFLSGSEIDIYLYREEITPDQINALHDEKFGKVETPEEAEVFDIMAQDNERLQNYEMGERVEWKNGDECVVSDEKFNVVLGCEKYIGQNGKVIGTHTNELGYHLAFIEFDDGACFAFRIEMLRKPETPQQREERERLEAAYELYVIAQHAIDGGVIDYSDFVKESRQLLGALAIVDKTGYRKQKDGE